MIEVPDEPVLPEIASLVCIDSHQTLELGGRIADQIAQAILNLEKVSKVEIVCYVGGRKRENEVRQHLADSPLAHVPLSFVYRKTWLHNTWDHSLETKAQRVLELGAQALIDDSHILKEVRERCFQCGLEVVQIP